MATAHNSAERGDFAETVLMPGDPLRAKFIAESFLTDAREVNNVRGMLGFTGLYNGKRVSVMGSGMGMPSIGIYSWELFSFYGVENIIRIGSAGAYDGSLKLFDVLLATGAWSESTFAKTQSGETSKITYPSEVLNRKLRQSAAAANIVLHEGLLHSSDVFYRSTNEPDRQPYWKTIFEEKHCIGVEMESFALFHNATVLKKNAAALLTVSDSFVTKEETTAEERAHSFTEMMKVALGAAVL